MEWNLIYRLRRFFRWLWNQEGSSGYKARGLAIGVFCGCFPLFGFQTLLGLALASVLRGNHLLAVSGTWISNPLTYLPIYWFNYTVGSVLLGYEVNMHDLSQFAWGDLLEKGWMFGSKLLLGSTLVGLIAGLLCGFFIYWLLEPRS